MEKGRVKSWEVTDDFWARVEPLVPQPVRDLCLQYKRQAGAGRPGKPARLVFEAIVYVLRTGCQWKALPFELFGSASAIHHKFILWSKVGFFEKLWRAGLAEYDDCQGIAWRWQSIDGAMFKAPLAQQAVGRNPTDRGKKWQQAAPVGGRAWCRVVARRHRSQPARREPTSERAGLMRGQTPHAQTAPQQAPVR